MKVPYIIYDDTIFLRKIDGGFAIAEDYTGVVRHDHQLPDIDEIKKLIKQAGKPFKGKRDRFVLVNLGDGYKAYQGWGIPSGNLFNRTNTQQDVQFILSQDKVEAVIFVDKEGNVEYESRLDEGSESQA